MRLHMYLSLRLRAAELLTRSLAKVRAEQQHQSTDRPRAPRHVDAISRASFRRVQLVRDLGAQVGARA